MCYLYPPSHLDGGPFGDGSPIQLHYSNRACFPMSKSPLLEHAARHTHTHFHFHFTLPSHFSCVLSGTDFIASCVSFLAFSVPFLPPDMVTFNHAFSLGPDFKFEDLEYEHACDNSVVQSLIGPMVGDLSTVGFIAAPYGSLLRFAEGIDSIRNLAGGSVSNTTDAHRAAAIVCGVAQLGGLMWLAVSLVVMGALCICAPLGSWCCLRCFRICRGASRRSAEREIAINQLLETQAEFGSNAAVRKVRRKVRVGPEGHGLLEAGV